MSKLNSTSLRELMHLPVEERLTVLQRDWSHLNIDLIASLINGFSRLI